MDISSGISGILSLVQIVFVVITGIYFWNMLKNQQNNKVSIERESGKELEKLQRLRRVALTEPLAEKTRPASLQDIVGQEEGIQALRAALCGPNPQHVIIYGPPGVGKTAAARLILEEAKKQLLSPFGADAKFVELDGATARFDERGIADPLIGSVHDPIYQGAGALGMAGIPQPKAGAVTKAHGGMLFIDEIGELHPIQINKLLKVLEDRKVMLESAYYSSEDAHVPSHIHDIFQNGLPADFRLIGATTRQPHEIPPAIRSRCLEVYFRSLTGGEIGQICRGAMEKMEVYLPASAIEVVQNYATNGREAVNIVQIAAGLALTRGETKVTTADVEWVVQSGQYSLRIDKKIPAEPQVGVVNGLALAGPSAGVLMEIEATVSPASPGKGKIIVTGIVDEEEIGSGQGKSIRRKSLVRSSVENVLTVMRQSTDIAPDDWDIHINFPGGTPVDGPSAGIAIATAVYSAIKNQPIDHQVAMTGELSVRGYVKPVGGIVAKVEAARLAGATRVLIPADNQLDVFQRYDDITVLPMHRLEQVLVEAMSISGKTTEDRHPAHSTELLPAPALGALGCD
ncbi:ATP-dependent protease LonB [Heliophilum fasciatum]|uniref:endopeptidase La n=1 Tax=Heliophilum fasciatum TaxID=35700 RepID=A0A4R2RV33_9FIRM|nr:ATP-dependent protease LonB [Heliophilum fasciatum]MCW2277447.1 Lon-like ATP-dependent protease [Heliophilum fasciatum]TCP67283.1 Lon-like ATP-dependent protease [Heliophilum fasciatum]